MLFLLGDSIISSHTQLPCVGLLKVFIWHPASTLYFAVTRNEAIYALKTVLGLILAFIFRVNVWTRTFLWVANPRG